MSTKYIAIAVGAVVVLGGAWYFLGNSSVPTAPATEGSESMQEGDDAAMTDGAADGTFTGSLGDLAKRGGNYQCTFTQDASGAKSSGTVYVSGYQIRGDFTSTVAAANMTITTHMVQDGGYDYVWSSASPMGFKTKVVGTSGGDGYAPTSGTQVNMGQSYGYKCVPWTVDKSKFTLPAGVQFTEN
jgi:hypothetical protein